MQAPHPMPEMENRIKRAIYRCDHRGTKELDLLLGQFARKLLANEIEGAATKFSQEERVAILEWLIAQPDHALQPWLIDGHTAPNEVPTIVTVALQAYDFRVQENH